MKIVIGNDHAAVDMKNEIKKYLLSKNFEVFDVGTNTSERCDYPDIAVSACKKIIDKECEFGILICGTGVGMSIAANKVKGIRACCCSESYSARLTRQHNNANVICFGARVIGIETAKDIVDNLLNTNFLGDYHINRLEKIKNIEENKY